MIDESKKRLREYIEEDKIYQDYKNNDKEPSDFERFCFVHCRDIENVLNENQQLKEVLDEIREYIETKLRNVNLTYGIDNEFREEYDDLLQILDKVGNNES